MKPARILLIEPDDVQQIGMRGALSASGYRCTGAASADVAAKLLGEPFEFVFIGPSFAEADARTIAEAIRPGLATPAAIVALTALSDCMIGRALSGQDGLSELPAALEALTRYLRFAPARKPSDPAEMQRLVGDWAEYQREIGRLNASPPGAVHALIARPIRSAPCRRPCRKPISRRSCAAPGSTCRRRRSPSCIRPGSISSRCCSGCARRVAGGRPNWR